MKILITGGAGFIGSHLTELLLAGGDEVFILDDLSTGSLQNLAHLQHNPAYARRLFVTIDTILNGDKLLELIGICDVVIHFAAAVGVSTIIDKPLESIVTNIQGTEKVLALCNKFRKKVLIASTSEVYGKHTSGPLVETDDCIYGPSTKMRWSYAASKLMDEFTALAYHQTTGLPTIIVRFFNTVGPRQTGRYGMVIPRFMDAALSGKPIPVYGTGQQTRTFTHVGEVVRAVNALIRTPEAIGEVINIGGVEEVSVLDLAKRVKAVTGSKSKIQLVPYRDVYPENFEDMQCRFPSTEKLKKLIGWAPEKTLDDILKDILTDSARISQEKEPVLAVSKR